MYVRMNVCMYASCRYNLHRYVLYIKNAQVASSLSWQYSIALYAPLTVGPAPGTCATHAHMPCTNSDAPCSLRWSPHGTRRRRSASLAAYAEAGGRAGGRAECSRPARAVRYWAYRAMITQELTNAPNSIGTRPTLARSRHSFAPLTHTRSHSLTLAPLTHVCTLARSHSLTGSLALALARSRAPY
jgi:hypothetical protein